MKKVLVFCLLTVFSAFYSVSAWGAIGYSITGSGTNLTLTITGTGAMPDYNNSNTSTRVPWYSNRANIKHVVIEDGVTGIGEYAFEGTKVADITIPVSVKSFGIKAFANRGETPSSNKIYYAGTPNQWADIDFALDGSYPTSHPFYNVAAANNHIYFYDQTSSETKIIAFKEGLKTIKSYVFWFAGNITDLCIPHSVTLIKTKAFWYCSNLSSITILSTSAPATETDAIAHIKSTSHIYLPANANASTSAPGFKRIPWYDSSPSGDGAKYIGSADDEIDYSASATGNNFGTGKVYPLSGSNSDFSWSLDMSGVLTIEGNGAISTTYSGSSFSSSSILPWGRFRRMIHKIIIKANGGDFTALNTVLRYHYALDTIVIDQTTIPTHGYIISETNNIANNFDKLFDKRQQVVLQVNSTSLYDASASNLTSEPWSNTKIDLNAKLDGRTLAGDPQYNTICLPFDLTDAQLQVALGSGYDLEEFEGSSLDGEELTLTFDRVYSLEAGKPYLIKPTANKTTPIFEGVTISWEAPESTTSTYVDFVGNFAPTELEGGDKNVLFLGAGNELFWPEATGNLGAFRAYFAVKGAARKAVRARMNMDGHSTPMSIKNVQENDVQGTKILRDGKLYLMYDGRMYDVQGRLVD